MRELHTAWFTPPPLPSLTHTGVPVVGDPLDSKQAESVINTAVASHGRVDGVVNCVGSIVLKSAHTTSDTDFDQVCVGFFWKGEGMGATEPVLSCS